MTRIGLDLSINSTGIVIDTGKQTYYYIITSTATKKMKAFGDKRVNVIIYNKQKSQKNDDYATKEKSKSANIILVSKILHEILSKHKENSIAFIEGISYGSIGSAAIADLSGLNFIVRYVLDSLGIPFIIVSPMANKKFACGIGNADKDVMINAWEKCQPKMVGLKDLLKVDDIADAYFLSHSNIS